MAKKDATTDTPKNDTVEGENVVGTGNDARLKMMAEINDKNDERLSEDGDLVDVNDDGTTSKFTSKEEETDEEIIAEETENADSETSDDDSEEDVEAEETDTEDEPVHVLKVNGKEVKLTTQELIERAQKVEAADEYLKLASEKLRGAEEKIPVSEQLSEQDAAQQALEEKRRFVRAIQIGSEEEAMAAFDQLASGNNPSYDEDDISRIVEQRIAFNDAYNRFQTEFPEIVKDPILWNVAIQMDAEMTKSGDAREYWDRYQNIGNHIRTWRNQLSSTSDAKKQDNAEKVDAKKKRKASASATPKGASVKAPASVEDDEREESPSEIIAQMAQARGGPQWLRG
jgi:hypothetical protein